MDRRTLLGAGAAAITVGGGFLWTQRSPEGVAPNLFVGMANAQTAEAIEIKDMVLGSAEAPVQVIEYASYTCPHCASFHGDQFKQLKENYIDTGKVRFVYREVYFDRFGLWASIQ